MMKKNIYSDIMIDPWQRTYIEHMKYGNQRIIVELKTIIVDLNHLVHMDYLLEFILEHMDMMPCLMPFNAIIILVYTTYSVLKPSQQNYKV